MTVVHLIRGYNKDTDALSVQYEIPGRLLHDAVRSIHTEDDDPDMHGVYPLAASQALEIARLIGHEMQVQRDLPKNDFFLEAEADHETVREQIRRLTRDAGAPR